MLNTLKSMKKTLAVFVAALFFIQTSSAHTIVKTQPGMDLVSQVKTAKALLTGCTVQQVEEIKTTMIREGSKESPLVHAMSQTIFATTETGNVIGIIAIMLGIPLLMMAMEDVGCVGKKK